MQGPITLPNRGRGLTQWVALLAVLLASGCYRQVPWRLSPPMLADTLVMDYRGERITLVDPALEGDSILVGWRQNPERTVVVSDLLGMHQERRPADSTFVRLPLRGVDRELKAAESTLAVLGGAFVAACVWTLLTFEGPTIDFGGGR